MIIIVLFLLIIFSYCNIISLSILYRGEFMLISIYQNNRQIPMIAYQQKIHLPRIYSANLGDTLLHIVNKKELPYSYDIFEHYCNQIEQLQQSLFQTIQTLCQNSYEQNDRNTFQSYHSLPILYYQNTNQKNDKLSFRIYYEYEPTVGFVQIYDVNTLQEAITVELIEYQKFVECDVLPPLKICPQCHTCFTSKRFDALFCSQGCVEKNFKKQKKKDVYYKKYRSLQQYYNKRMNQWSQKNPSSAELYKKQYALWQSLAKREYEKLSDMEKEELPDVTAYVKKLKGYWTIATTKTKR